ncbi:MAG: rhodanese-related sulfurtransferase [Gammaproteobacteria bacterium]|nr:rhodanese-related sulfurtransferase [Gammaproteobacteria bacterium]
MKSVVTFYKFVQLHKLEFWQTELLGEARELQIKGTVLLAEEGINGTLVGEKENLERFAAVLTGHEVFSDMEFKYSQAQRFNPVFYRLKVRIKREIVSFEQPLDPSKDRGIPVDAERWNELLQDPEVVVIDTRNSYEVAIGSFPGAKNPDTGSFREFPAFLHAKLNPRIHKRVAMYCTGGIRCEKASAYLLENNFEQVYQLQGGILKYLETVSPEQNRWQGECFVFDQRVSVNDELGEGSYQQCFACRRALSREDLNSPHFQQGVSCPGCIDELDDRRRAGLEERQRQVRLAQARGSPHIGQRQG